MFEPRNSHSFDHELHGGSTMRMQVHFVNEMTLPVTIQTWELPPGGSEGMHAHEPGAGALEEFYLVLEGVARMQVGAEIHELCAGDSVLAQVGVNHDITNVGTELLRVLVVWGPQGEVDFSAYGSVVAAKATKGQPSRRTSPGPTPCTDRKARLKASVEP